jgi:hypothetical protein
MPTKLARTLGLTELKKFRLSWRGGLAVFVGTILVVLLSFYFGRLELAAPTAYSMATLVVAIAFKWKLRRHVWFWAVMFAIAALHVPLILYVPWTTDRISPVVAAPFMAADLTVIVAILTLLEKRFEKSTSGEDHRQPATTHRRSADPPLV